MAAILYFLMVFEYICKISLKNKVLFNVDIINFDWLVKLVSLVCQKILKVFQVSFENLAQVVNLNQDDPDVHLVPGYRLEDLELSSLNVQTEEVHPRIAKGFQDAVQGEALHSDSSLVDVHAGALNI